MRIEEPPGPTQLATQRMIERRGSTSRMWVIRLLRQQVEDRRLQVVDVHHVVGHLEAEVVARPMHVAGLHRTPSHPHGIAVAIVVAAENPAIDADRFRIAFNAATGASVAKGGTNVIAA
jgi:hypothetical protein